METKKIYKIGNKIEVEEVQAVASGIVRKALKVIETSGNNWASRIIEGKDVDTFEDLKGIVILELVENNYVISKKCYQLINKYMYNYKVNKIKSVDIVINEDNSCNIDHNSYVEYVKNIDNYYECKEVVKKFNLHDLKLTNKQLEILNIFSKLGTYGKTAEVLGVAKSTVQVTIERIRKKALATCNSIG